MLLFGFASPRKNTEPYCLDMSTTNISWNKLLNYKTLRKKDTADIAIDIWSAPTNKSNPTDVTFSRFVLALHIKSVTTR